MGVYIDMEMPKDVTLLAISPDGTVDIISGQPDLSWKTLKHKAISVPTHGRLGDLDAMLMRINHEVMEAYMDGVCYGAHPSQEHLYLLGEIIDDAPPTIIPASVVGGAE